VHAGQTVEWSALAVDVQTPLVIKSITFLTPDGANPAAASADAVAAAARATAPAGAAAAAAPAATDDQRNPDAQVWSGVVPFTMTPLVPYRYRLELQMDQGEQSVLTIDAPALMRL
jgi:hypothetical protein